MKMKIKDFRIQKIPLKKNKPVDALVNLASSFDFVIDKNIPLEFLPNPSINIAKTNIFKMTTKHIWMDDIAVYLKSGELPFDKFQARQIRYRLTRFCLLQWTLYKRSFSGPLLRCFKPKEEDNVLKEIHEGI